MFKSTVLFEIFQLLFSTTACAQRFIPRTYLRTISSINVDHMYKKNKRQKLLRTRAAGYTTKGSK